MNILFDTSEVYTCSLQKHDFNKGWQVYGKKNNQLYYYQVQH